MKRQLLLSSGVPCKSLGNQARGTEIVRPSLRSTASVSSPTLTFCAFASAVKELIPTPQQVFPVVLDQFLYAFYLSPAEAAASLQSHRIEPELGLVFIAFDVNVRRLVCVASIKEEPVRPKPQNSGMALFHSADQSHPACARLVA